LILEQPLQRPVEETADTPFEKPLQRPRETGLLPNFHDIPVAIAIDISGSTQGKVLEQEINAAQKICGILSDQTSSRARILPWDHDMHAVMVPKSLPTLGSEGGGTNPSVLMSESDAVDVLSKSSCWLLFTDGAIDDFEIRAFSDGIRRNGLHGTACVVVIFGYKARKPTSCNVSVGLSMFSAAPDCLFLFHDIDTEEIYVLQSKGTFNELLPAGQKEVILDRRTLWNHLPKITYQDLLRVRIPAPRKLGADDLLLQSNRTVGLQDIYDDKIDAATASEIIDNDDNLKSLLLTSQLRGQNESVGRWIQKQKLKDEDMLHIPRPDVDSKASFYIKILLQGFRSGDYMRDKSILQDKLRASHQVNWASFISDAGLKQKKASRRSQVVHDSISRIKLNQDEVDGPSAPCSPVLLSPVTPMDEDESEGIEPERIRSSYSHRSKEKKTKSLSRYLPTSSASSSEISLPLDNSTGSSYLYIPGYRYDRGSASAAGLEGTCPLCNSPESVLSLLLKKYPLDITTPGFPSPNSRAGLAFPLAMGTFPETDILSPFVCCDSCAYHLVQLHESPYEEDIIAAIPLIPEAFSGNFQDTTFDAVDDALDKRFEKPAIEQVLLAVIYNTLESSEGEYETIEKEALRWASSMISLQTSLPATLSSSFSGHLSPRGYIRLPMALSQSLASLQKPSSPLLQYPLNGFVVMIQSMIDLNLEPRPNARQNAVFQRILFHITEKHHEFYLSDSKCASEALRSILWRPQTEQEEQAEASSSTSTSPDAIPQTGSRHNSVAILSIPIITLRDTHLLSEYDWDILQRLGSLFDHVKDDCPCALAFFLHALNKHISASLTAIEVFDKMRTMKDLRKIFQESEEITEDSVNTGVVQSEVKE
jgi:hypothetical protein